MGGLHGHIFGRSSSRFLIPKMPMPGVAPGFDSHGQVNKCRMCSSVHRLDLDGGKGYAFVTALFTNFMTRLIFRLSLLSYIYGNPKNITIKPMKISIFQAESEPVIMQPPIGGCAHPLIADTKNYPGDAQNAMKLRETLEKEISYHSM